jgi:hypothetical protein
LLRNKRIVVTTGLAFLTIFAIGFFYNFLGQNQKSFASWDLIPSEFTHKTTISFPAVEQDSKMDLLNYRVQLDLQSPELKYVAFGGKLFSAMAMDIAFTKNDGKTVLDHKIKSYDPEKGILSVWILMDTVKTIAENDVVLYYGNEGVANNLWRQYSRESKHRDTTFALNEKMEFSHI